MVYVAVAAELAGCTCCGIRYVFDGLGSGLYIGRQCLRGLVRARRAGAAGSEAAARRWDDMPCIEDFLAGLDCRVFFVFDGL